MKKFDSIYATASKRKGGDKQLQKLLPKVLPDNAVKTIPDDRFLAEMSRCVFQAGFVWRVVNQKWPDFEKVFFGFVPDKLVLLSPEQLERIGQNPAIIRNMQKIISVQKNAQFVLDQRKEYGSFGKLVAGWPTGDHIGLYKMLKQKGCRLGGATGPRMLRNLQVDGFILTHDVVSCLQQAGLDINDKPTSQSDLKKVQQAFNSWHQQSGLPYSHLSRICACAVGENYPPEAFTH